MQRPAAIWISVERSSDSDTVVRTEEWELFFNIQSSVVYCVVCYRNDWAAYGGCSLEISDLRASATWTSYFFANLVHAHLIQQCCVLVQVCMVLLWWSHRQCIFGLQVKSWKTRRCCRLGDAEWLAALSDNQTWGSPPSSKSLNQRSGSLSDRSEWLPCPLSEPHPRSRQRKCSEAWSLHRCINS